MKIQVCAAVAAVSLLAGCATPQPPPERVAAPHHVRTAAKHKAAPAAPAPTPIAAPVALPEPASRWHLRWFH
jgi:hypothetical protein